MNREKAKKMAQSRDCHCIKGKDRDSNYNECIDKIFDYFETSPLEATGYKDLLAELYERLEIQKKLIYEQLADPHHDKQEFHMMEGKEQLLIELIEFYSKKSL